MGPREELAVAKELQLVWQIDVTLPSIPENLTPILDLAGQQDATLDVAGYHMSARRRVEPLIGFRQSTLRLAESNDSNRLQRERLDEFGRRPIDIEQRPLDRCQRPHVHGPQSGRVSGLCDE